MRPRWLQLRDGVVFHQEAVEEVRSDLEEVVLADGSVLSYDVLVIATGARLQPEETEGLTDAGWGRRTFTFYEREGAEALHEALSRFDRGRLVVNLVDIPIKCPVAPLEFAFLADAYFHERDMRRYVDLVFATPLDGAFTKPVASARLGGLLAEKGIELAGTADARRRLRHADCRQTTTGGGVPVKELHELFPKGPAKLAGKIARTPQPRGCIISVGEFYALAAGGQIVFA